jgi:Fic family protein
MSLEKTQYQSDSIKKALSQFTNGATLAEIQQQINSEIGRRTLLRRLAEMENLGEIMIIGSGRATRYLLSEKAIAGMNKPVNKASGIPLSKESETILSLVSQPEQRRNPVTYHREFLENYDPNQTNYLTADDKEKLAERGKAINADYPAGTYARQILNRLLIDLSWNSSRLEGNTYSLLDTERLIAAGIVADEKSAMDTQMILNHKDAIEFIVNNAADIKFNRYTILSLHSLLSDNLLPDSAASGRLRNHPVGIGKSVYTPLAIPQLIEEMFGLILEKANAINNPFEQSFFVMVHLPYLQPFIDVNKRVSRLAANIPLVKNNLSPLSFIDVPKDMYIYGQLGVYELNRVGLLKDVFMWSYERSAMRYAAVRQSIGEPDQFKLKYRQDLRAVISEIIRSASTSKESSSHIRAYADKIAEADRTKFIEAAETELLSLHDGNFARYYISPSEFDRWKKSWQHSGKKK